MIKFLFKLLAFYVVVFGLLGILVLLNESLFDLQTTGNLFLRISPMDYIAAFFFSPLFGLMSFATSIPNMSTFATDAVEVHVLIILFFLLAFYGLWKGSRFILLIAALLPLSWAIIDLDLFRYI